MGRYQTGAEDLSLTYTDLLNCISKRLHSYKNNHILLICGIQRSRPSREEIYGRQWDKLFSFTSMHSWQNSRRSSLSIDIYIKSTEYALNVTYIHTAKLRLFKKKKKINNFFPLFSVIENGSDTSTLTWIRIFVRLICTQIYFFFHVNPVSFVALSGNIFTFVSRQKISIQNMIVILTGEGVRLINKTTTLLLF